MRLTRSIDDVSRQLLVCRRRAAEPPLAHSSRPISSSLVLLLTNLEATTAYETSPRDVTAQPVTAACCDVSGS